jgi:hypothetical protein
MTTFSIMPLSSSTILATDSKELSKRLLPALTSVK